MEHNIHLKGGCIIWLDIHSLALNENGNYSVTEVKSKRFFFLMCD